MQHCYRTHDANKSIEQLGLSGSPSQYRHQDDKKSEIDPSGQSTNDEEKQLSPSKLRAKLRAELEQKARSCLHAGYKCSRPPATPASDYCALHILQSTGSSDPALVHYIRCAYVYSVNGRRCPNAAPKKRSVQNALAVGSSTRQNQMQNQSYCFEHSRLAQRTRTKQLSRRKPPQCLESTLYGLSHYLVNSLKEKSIKIREGFSYYWSQESQDRDEDTEEEEEPIEVTHDENGKILPLDPMTKIDPELVEKLRSPLQYASSTESEEEEPIIYGDVDQSVAFLGSDDECLEDVSAEDPLKHAGIYSAVEANAILRDKLSRLQELYVDQFKVLQQELKIKKMKMIPALRREYETLCSTQDQPKDSAKELNLYRKLSAFKRYNKKSGVEAILHGRSLERTAKYMDGFTKFSLHRPSGNPATGPKCIFAEGGIKCTDRPMPCTKYCRRHILQDKRQILFKPCATEIGAVCCTEPITGILEIDTCPLHYNIPEPRTYNIRKEDSDTENSEDEPDEHSNLDTGTEHLNFETTSRQDVTDEIDLTAEQVTPKHFQKRSSISEDQHDFNLSNEDFSQAIESISQIDEFKNQDAEVEDCLARDDISLNEQSPNVSETSVIIEPLSDDLEIEDV